MRLHRLEVAAFGTADGMESSETNGEGQPAGWKARDGRLWFPTTLGVVVIDPKEIAINEVPPPVIIEQVKADQVVLFGDDARIEHEARDQSSYVSDRLRPLSSPSTINHGSLATTRRMSSPSWTSRSSLTFG